MLIGAMLVRNEESRYLERVLEQMAKVCDKIIVLDDCSTDNTPEICKEYGAEVYPSIRSYWGTNELKQRKLLWELATYEKPDWILCLDADETIPRIDLLPDKIELAEQYGCDGLAFNLYDMWDEKHYRDDELWNAHTRDWVMCVRYNPAKEYIWRETQLHCGRFPLNACEQVGQTGLAIQHWGWAREADREAKYKRYMQSDPEGEYGCMEQYQSILDEKPTLMRFGMEANTKEWWENEFEHNWRIGIDGVEQTRYFMKRILEAVQFNQGASVLDWGCAMGQGVDELNKAGYVAEGYDFSETAIKTAKEMYPEYGFTHEWPNKTYDVVISSNCFEHFTNPLEWLEKVLTLSNKYVVIMTPYNQIPHEVHPITITENSFPQKFNGFKMLAIKLVPSKEAFYDGGDQIMFIYEKEAL
jgi:glycosyltransferase involved in cell wall biosynthesis